MSRPKAIILFLLILAGLGYAVVRQSSTPLLRGYITSSLPARYAVIAASKPKSYLVTQVSVIPMTMDTILRNQSVLIVDGTNELKDMLTDVRDMYAEKDSSHP